MKKIISIFLALVLCTGLCASLSVSALAEEASIAKTVTFPDNFTDSSKEEVKIWGHYVERMGIYYLNYYGERYPFTVEVPENCQLTKVTFEFHWSNCWPNASCGTVTKSGEYNLIVTFNPEDNVHSVVLDGGVYSNPQSVRNLVVEYNVIHTHRKNENTHHARVAPLCGKEGSMEYWECIYPGCEAKLDSEDRSIADISIPFDPDAHSFSTEWVFDDDYHWHESTCIYCGHSDKDDHLEHNRDLTKSGYPCRDCGAEIPWWYSSVISRGSIWIISGVAVLAAAAVVTLIVVKRKKKPALAEGVESENKE